MTHSHRFTCVHKDTHAPHNVQQPNRKYTTHIQKRSAFQDEQCQPQVGRFVAQESRQQYIILNQAWIPMRDRKRKRKIKKAFKLTYLHSEKVKLVSILNFILQKNKTKILYLKMYYSCNKNTFLNKYKCITYAYK